VVQLAEDVYSRQQFAVKFFLSKQAFQQEAGLYEDPDQPLGRFLPQCRAIVDPEAGQVCRDKHGHPLPPFIVMEKGEALDKWAARSEDSLDFVTGLQVRRCRSQPPCLSSAGPYSYPISVRVCMTGAFIGQTSVHAMPACSQALRAC
jgi:hypothetical protein